ncbi:HAD family hydrolase [Granulosicoccaceae sp. 1_MG-2023]|nr:HAD family hydrolase [Granulosicoccaceae sp. 1_MG-2023]
MTDFDLILFDCDGVLVDSEILAAEVGADVLVRAGVPITAQEICQDYAGMEWQAIIRELENRHQVSVPETLFAESNRLLDQVLATQLEAVEGAAELLDALRGQRCICSNSSSPRLTLELQRTGLDHFFSPHIYSAVDLGPGRTKPQPDIYLHGAAQFDADPARCLVVEDSVHGVTAARRAGMQVIGFTGARHSYQGHGERLCEAGAAQIADTMPALQALLREHGLT